MKAKNQLQSEIHDLTLEILQLKMATPYAPIIKLKQIKLDQLLDVQFESSK